ncbi:MAG: TetR/AcrR family transcriptional regulator [Oscillospiraceae bacterium]|nr:TetR/AcrR family transcriptional regulator [Oscillospiraceae bacterium]
MDRRQRKTREAIFSALIELLAGKDFGHITVGEIIDRADVGRATFYAHFETKDHLLQALCDDLFCHILDGADTDHRHLFRCDAPECVFLHLFRHLLKNDDHILDLLSCQNNDLFLRRFKAQLHTVVKGQLPQFRARKSEKLPEDFWIDHICAVFIQTLRWWIDHGMQESPETITEYFFLAV